MEEWSDGVMEDWSDGKMESWGTLNNSKFPYVREQLNDAQPNDARSANDAKPMTT